MEEIVIVAATRTAVGKFGGSLAKIAAPELGAIVVKDLLVVDAVCLQPFLQDEVVVIDGDADLVRQPRWIHEVGNANAAPGNLVLVGRADSASRGANRLCARRAFASLIHCNVIRHDQRRRRADLQAPELAVGDDLDLGLHAADALDLGRTLTNPKR